jgi:hypothetical protein
MWDKTLSLISVVSFHPAKTNTKMALASSLKAFLGFFVLAQTARLFPTGFLQVTTEGDNSL